MAIANMIPGENLSFKDLYPQLRVVFLEERP